MPINEIDEPLTIIRIGVLVDPVKNMELPAARRLPPLKTP